MFESAYARVVDGVAGALDLGPDREHSAEEAEHLGHERNAFQAALLVQRRENLGWRSQLDTVACLHEDGSVGRNVGQPIDHEAMRRRACTEVHRRAFRPYLASWLGLLGRRAPAQGQRQPSFMRRRRLVAVTEGRVSRSSEQQHADCAHRSADLGVAFRLGEDLGLFEPWNSKNSGSRRREIRGVWRTCHQT